MRIFLGALLALLAAAGTVASAGEIEHKRGEYRFSVGAEPGFVDVKQLPAQWDAKAPGASGVAWRVWLFDEQVDRRGGRDHVYIDYAYQAQSASLLGSAGRYQIVFNPEYQKLVIHAVELRRGGQWLDRLNAERISLARREEDFEEDMADGNVTALIVLEDVRVDDVVRLRYSIVGSNPILAGQLVDANNFGWHNPMLSSRLRVLHEPGTELDVRREAGAPAASVRKSADAVEVLLEMSRIPAYTNEGAYPLWYQQYPAAYVAKKREWADVVAWALPLYPEAALPADLEKELGAWSKLPTPRERVKAALRAVQEQVRYFGAEMGANSHRPTPPAETWARRYGDCKDKVYLLRTLLARMGIDAVPALVSTRRGRGIADTPPAASVFDHVIVRAQVDGTTLWLDPTITAEGGDPRDSDASVYGLALPIAAGTKALQAIDAPAGIKASVEVRERYEPASDGKEVRLMIETVYQGRSANDVRRSFSGARNEEIERRYAEYYRKRFGELAVVKSPAIQDDRDANRLSVAEQYLLKAPFESDGRVRALNVYAESMDAPSRLPDSIARSGPLYVGMPAHYRHEIQVRMPERWTSSLIEESRAFRSEAFAYERNLTMKDRQIDLVHDLRITHRDMSADKVASHLGELRKVREELSARIPLRLPDGGQRQERDARLKALLKDLDGGN